MLVKTANSTYEIFPEQKRFRRAIGTHQAEHQIDNWQTFHSMSEPKVGESLTIVWHVEDFPNDVVRLRTIQTSLVKEILDLPFVEVSMPDTIN